ncbi:unnamed protein product [Oikopleura dioica]|uniref:J domain-containing protein n=1 Tax=Oikopleura dioica TaxID=34765 RepID=E4XS01_OIKDI|nr:unnamed protein product [Oikopleura dioica]
MADSTKCFYEILGVSQEAEEDEIQEAFEASKQAFEASKTAFEVLNDPKKRGAYDRQKENTKINILEKLEEKNLIHIRDQIFGALDDRDIHNCSQVSKSWQNFMKTNRHMRKKKMRMEMGEIGGAGHFWGNDKETQYGGVRDKMGEEEFKKVLRLLAAGEKKVNLKFWFCQNWEVAEAGWTIQFKTAFIDFGGDGKFYLWIGNKGGAKFKATAQQINYGNGEEKNRLELQSEKDGTRQRIKYELVARYVFVRFNITIL